MGEDLLMMDTQHLLLLLPSKTCKNKVKSPIYSHLGLSHSKIVVLIESAEESGSNDLPYYVEKLKTRMGDVGLVICLDSGCGNYEQLWLTTSLRGIADGTLQIQVLKYFSLLY
jgi:hypothetical protein